MASQGARVLNRIFVNNLPWTISHRELFEYFSQFGHVTSSKVVFDKSTGLSQKYGFVEYSSRNGFDNALSKKDHILEGNYINIQQST